ncbi:MAG TPA: hypothetical protein QF716_04115 [Candidatus Thalassarchaeaceae archaeon]|nr:hypothetical protein [Candidatus Thalassarchaeaceae archaeon]HJM68043.1 hypothetical protein [Candidatus Thalassarchaeaceae archaeon]
MGFVKNPELAPLWAIIQEMVAKHEPQMQIKLDEPGDYSLIRINGRPFARTKVQKKHVGLYLMPLHENQDLFESLNPGLKSRLNGKCLRFQDEDDPVIASIPALLQASADLGEH